MVSRPGPRRPQLGAAGAGLFSVFLVGSLVAVPLLGALIAPLGLIPVVQYLVTGRPAILAWGWVALALAVAAGLGGWSLAFALLLAYLLVVGLPASSLEWWLAGGWSEGRWVAVTTGVATVASLAVFAAVTWPHDPVVATTGWLHSTFSQAESLYPAGNWTQGSVALALDAWERWLGWLAPTVPVAYLVLVLFWIRPRLAVFGFRAELKPFERYGSEEWLPLAFALSGVATLILRGPARWVAVNCLAAVLILYFVHGLAIIRAHLARWIGRGWLVRWGVAFVCLQVPLSFVVAALGVADSFVTLRPHPPSDDGRHE